MMTDEEIQEYITENEPTTVVKNDDCGRWESRAWVTDDDTTITETYTYKNAVTHRQCFKVKSVTVKEVSNG